MNSTLNTDLINTAWKRVISYGASNRCSAELAIACVCEDHNYPPDVEKALFNRLWEERRGAL